MRRMFSIAQTPLNNSPTTYTLSQVPWPVSKFSKPPLPTDAQVGMKKTTTDNTTELRKGTSWSSRLDKQTNNVITHNIVGCGELTARVTD